MRLIHAEPPPCPCYALLDRFERENAQLGVGSIVECDCTQQYKLVFKPDHGPMWELLARCVVDPTRLP